VRRRTRAASHRGRVGHLAARTPAGGVGDRGRIRNSSRGWCAFTCQPGATIASTTACHRRGDLRPHHVLGAAPRTPPRQATSTATAAARRIAPDSTTLNSLGTRAAAELRPGSSSVSRHGSTIVDRFRRLTIDDPGLSSAAGGVPRLFKVVEVRSMRRAARWPAVGLSVAVSRRRPPRTWCGRSSPRGGQRWSSDRAPGCT